MRLATKGFAERERERYNLARILPSPADVSGCLIRWMHSDTNQKCSQKSALPNEICFQISSLVVSREAKLIFESPDARTWIQTRCFYLTESATSGYSWLGHLLKASQLSPPFDIRTSLGLYISISRRDLYVSLIGFADYQNDVEQHIWLSNECLLCRRSSRLSYDLI